VAVRSRWGLIVSLKRGGAGEVLTSRAPRSLFMLAVWCPAGGRRVHQNGAVARGDAHPWDRMVGESAQAYGAFLAYRARGPLRTVAAGRSIDRRWSARWRWASRAQAWDDELQQATDAATLDAIRSGWRSAYRRHEAATSHRARRNGASGPPVCFYGAVHGGPGRRRSTVRGR